jgi:hypothetical protein
MSTDHHRSRRPSWECRSCGSLWPCAPARSALTEEFRQFPTVLRLYLAAQMVDAIEDLRRGGGPVPADLYGRFCGWAADTPDGQGAGARAC